MVPCIGSVPPLLFWPQGYLPVNTDLCFRLLEVVMNFKSSLLNVWIRVMVGLTSLQHLLILAPEMVMLWSRVLGFLLRSLYYWHLPAVQFSPLLLVPYIEENLLLSSCRILSLCSFIQLVYMELVVSLLKVCFLFDAISEDNNILFFQFSVNYSSVRITWFREYVSLFWWVIFLV